jgi:hypothetical protein
MDTFLLADAPIIRPGCIEPTDAGKDAASMQQVRYRTKRCRLRCFTRCGGIQVRPGGWNERARTIGQDQNEIKRAVAPHPAKQRQRLAFQWVPRSDDRDFGRVALEVGSVLPFRSTLFHTISCYARYDGTPTSGGSYCMWNAG